MAARKPKPAKVEDFPLVAASYEWARKVLKGKIPACRFIRLAIQRHFDDLAASKTAAFKYKFDPAEAERRLTLVNKLPHTKGEWARKGLRITLEPWQSFGLGVTFGWKRKKDGLRRFREAYWEVPRKNGKSVIAAAVGILMFVADREFGAEVYCGATTEKQANEVFTPAKIMLQKSPALVKAAGVQINAQTLVRPSDNSRFERIIGNPGDGASPSCSIVDEYHEHDTDALYETMITGMGARLQPLMFVITTAGYNIAGPCFDRRRQVIEMLEGTVPDDELFGYIWTIDEGDDWTDPRVMAKANPNFGVSIYQDYLESQQGAAKRNARKANAFKTKHLNVWVSSKSGFFNVPDWMKCADPNLKVEHFAGEPSILGFDLARKLDLTAMARLFWRDIGGKRHYYCVDPKFWVPEDTVHNTDNRRIAERYQAWVNSGHLDATDGAEIDYRVILDEAVCSHTLNPVRVSPMDPHGATNLAHQLEDEGLTPLTLIQNFTNLSDGMKELEAAITSGRFHHDGNPIMTWCIANVIGKTMGKGGAGDDIVRPDKQGVDNKIDGAVALIMAVGRAMLEDRVSAGSIYDNPDQVI